MHYRVGKMPERKFTLNRTRKRYVFARLAILACLAPIAAAPLAAAGNFLYIDTTATLSYTTFVGPTPIPGLSLNLPAATTAFNTAVVTLSMPNLYLSQPTSRTDSMSADIQVVAPFSPAGVISAFGGIGCDTPTVRVSGKKPITIVIKVPLGTSSQFVEGEWDSSNGTVNTDTFASLSAILVRE